MSYPFSCKNIEKSAMEIASQFSTDSSSVENEAVQTITYIHLKTTASDTKFQCFISEETYSNLNQVALQLTAMFKSTYLSASSEMTIIKSRQRNQLTNLCHHACNQQLVITYHLTKSMLWTCSVKHRHPKVCNSLVTN